VGASSGLTSYEGISHQLKTAAADPAVQSIVLDLHSPGGEAVGAFEAAALVRQIAAQKRTIAVVNGMAASAAYAIASGANDIIVTETGVAGSIGVVMLHADFSRQLDREGVTPTLIHAGAHKVDGNPFEPLPDAVRTDLQAEVDAFYDSFLATVAKGRGSRLTAAAARKTEARTFIGKAAVAAGLADRVGTFETALAELTRARGQAQPQNRRTSMDHDLSAARTEGMAKGVASERTRLTTVLKSEHYKGREAAAHHMMFETDMAADAIVGVLAASPKVQVNSFREGPIEFSSIYGGRRTQSQGLGGISNLAPPAASHQAATAADIYAARRKTTQQR
jgi:signal peptide peptidase SppA